MPTFDLEVPINELDKAFSLFSEASFRPVNESAAKYKVIIVERHRQVRDMLVECLRFSGFDAEGYAEPELLLREILPRRRQMPDLFVVDLELQVSKSCSTNLIEHLTDSNVPSAIMALANLSSVSVAEAMKMGAEDVVHKPFDVFQIVERVETLADIGKKRRLYREDQFSLNPTKTSRPDRPIFLSYSHKDKRIASVLRSHIEAHGIGVWYAPDNLQPGDFFRKRLFEAIDQAQVFVPLITDNYPNSPFCMAELVRFYRRLRIDKSPLLLPVLNACPAEIENFDWIKPIIEEHQYADITSELFVDGLTALLGRIQKTIASRGQV